MNIRQIEEKFYPTNDYVFKRIFGYKGNEEITKAFLNAILSTPVKSVTLETNPITLKDLKDDKDFLSEYGVLKKYTGGLEIELTNDLELYIIELPKLENKLAKGEKIDNKKLMAWLKFIINPNEVEETDMEENKELMWASNELEYISEDEHERFLAEQREEFRRLEVDLKAAGFEEGQNEKAQEIAKKLLKEKMEITFIAKITGLTEREIESLKE